MNGESDQLDDLRDTRAAVMAEIDDLRSQVAALTAQLQRLQPRRTVYIRGGVEAESAELIDPTVTLWSSPERPITIGRNTRIYRNAEINGPVSIGAGCMFNRDAYIRQGCTIGDAVFLGPFVRLITDSHQIGSASQRAGANTVDPIVIGDGTWLGAGSIVLPGVRIGRGCVIAAGSIVAKDVPDNSLVAGVPARLIRQLEP